MARQRIMRLEGSEAFKAMVEHLKAPIGERPKINVIGIGLLGEPFTIKGVVVRHRVLGNAGKPGCASIFQVTDLFKSKSGQPLPQRFAWPGDGKLEGIHKVFPLQAIEVLSA